MRFLSEVGTSEAHEYGRARTRPASGHSTGGDSETHMYSIEWSHRPDVKSAIPSCDASTHASTLPRPHFIFRMAEIDSRTSAAAPSRNEHGLGLGAQVIHPIDLDRKHYAEDGDLVLGQTTRVR